MRINQIQTSLFAFFTRGWCCTMMWHQKLASCFAVDRTIQGPGLMWRPWPGLQALSSVSGSSCGRCLTTSAPALRERGKGEGGKDARAAVNNPHLQQWQQQRYRFQILSHSLMFCVMYSFVIRKYRKSAFFVCFPLLFSRSYYGKVLTYEY